MLVVEAKDSTFNVAEDLIVIAPAIERVIAPASLEDVIAEPSLELVAVAVADDGVVETAADHILKLADRE